MQEESSRKKKEKYRGLRYTLTHKRTLKKKKLIQGWR